MRPTTIAVALSAVLGGGCAKEKPSDPAAGGPAEQPRSKDPEPTPKPPASGGSASQPSTRGGARAPAPGKAEVGEPAPDFALTGLDGATVKLSDHRGKVVVLEWFNPQCPFVKKSHTKGSLVDAAKRHQAAGVVWLAINSGAPGAQGHDPEVNRRAAVDWALDHPILRDPDGTVGRAYGATNTPNMFVIDEDGLLVYAGAIDNSPDGEGESPAGGTLINHVDAALADLAAGRPVATPTTKPYGCSVKYAS